MKCHPTIADMSWAFPSQPFTRWRAQVCESYLILVSAAAPILKSLQKKLPKTEHRPEYLSRWQNNGSTPLPERSRWGKWSTCGLTQRPHHCLSSSNPRIKRNDVLFSQHFPGQTPLNNWPFCANGRVPCHLSQGHIEFTAIPADRTDEPKRTIELEWVDRIWSTRECVQHVDAYAQIGACWNQRFTTSCCAEPVKD